MTITVHGDTTSVIAAVEEILDGALLAVPASAEPHDDLSKPLPLYDSTC